MAQITKDCYEAVQIYVFQKAQRLAGTGSHRLGSSERGEKERRLLLNVQLVSLAPLIVQKSGLAVPNRSQLGLSPICTRLARARHRNAVCQRNACTTR